MCGEVGAGWKSRVRGPHVNDGAPLTISGVSVVKERTGNLVSSALLLLMMVTAVGGAEHMGGEGKLNWDRDVRDAWRSALKFNRPLLVFITMDDCIYCQKMKQTTLQDQHVMDNLRTQFVPVALNVKDAPDFVRLLTVKTFPTTVIIETNGDVIQSISGYKSVHQFRRQLHTALRYAHRQQAVTNHR